jgi:adenine-specific DNA-methyltransferase
MAQNAADGGSRSFILVQLPEPLDVDNKDQRAAAELCDALGRPRTIAELTKERLRRAGSAIRDVNPLFAGDVGFRVFKLAPSAVRAWRSSSDALEQSLLDGLDHIDPSRSVDDLLFELLLKVGLDPRSSFEERSFAGKRVFRVSTGALFLCFDRTIANEDVQLLATGIADWIASVDGLADAECLFRDDAFVDDVAKVNLSAILAQHGISNVKSL